MPFSTERFRDLLGTLNLHSVPLLVINCQEKECVPIPQRNSRCNSGIQASTGKNDGSLGAFPIHARKDSTQNSVR
jgi:hypothetical protein